MVDRRLLCACLLLSASVVLVSAKKELKLLHVLSANRFYVPDYNDQSKALEIPKNLSYKYFVENALDIPNNIKMHLYTLGTRLRQEYDTFLGSVYTDEVIKMQTAAFPTSIIAGELINAGLWPPVGTQIWKDDLLWQPIPFVYEAMEEDTELLGTLCPNFQYETESVLKNRNLTETEDALLKYIMTEGSLQVKNPIDVSLLYLAVENGVELNQALPPWLKSIYTDKKKLLNVTLSAYDLLSTTIVQKRLNGGSFLKTVIKDSKDHINGTLSSARKINVYSGDERNLAGVLKNLGIPMHDLPDAGAALIFELYAEGDQHFIKVLHYTGAVYQDMVPQRLEGCELFCPLEKFVKLVADVLPESELSLCGSKVAHGAEGDKPGAGAGSSAIESGTSSVIFVMMSMLAVFVAGRS